MILKTNKFFKSIIRKTYNEPKEDKIVILQNYILYNKNYTNNFLKKTPRPNILSIKSKL